MNNERLLNCPEINVNENTMNPTQILNESNNKNLKCYKIYNKILIKHLRFSV